MAPDQIAETTAALIAGDSDNPHVDNTSSTTTPSSTSLASESPHHQTDRIHPTTSFDQTSMAAALDSINSREQAAGFTSSGGTTHHSTPMSSTVRSAGERLVGTFELLESILAQLGIQDLLRARGASTQFRDVVDKSTTLQIHLGLKQPKRSYCYMPLLEQVGSNKSDDFEFHLRKSCSSWAPNKKFSINITLDKGQLRLGSLVRRIQLCHPPLTSISMTWWIEWPREYDPNCLIAEKYILTTSASRTEGLTLGDLCDAFARVCAKDPASTWLRGRRRLIKYAGAAVNSAIFDSTFVTPCPATENELEKLHEETYGVSDAHKSSHPIVRSASAEAEMGVTDMIDNGQRKSLGKPSKDDVVDQPQPFVPPQWEYPDRSTCDYLGKVIFGSGGIEQWTDPGTIDDCHECFYIRNDERWDDID